jgi:hypothetical protein
MSDQDRPADQPEEVREDPKERVEVPGEPRDPAKQRAVITRALIAMMAVGLLIHYGAVITLEWSGKHESVKSLETILNAWLPVLSGLVGAAVTYYFTREDHKHL